MRSLELFFYFVLYFQNCFGGVNYLRVFSPIGRARQNSFCSASYPIPGLVSSSDIDSIRNQLMDRAKDRFVYPETSEAFADLIGRAADAVTELISDGSSRSFMDVTGRTGRLFSETTSSFARLLGIVDELLSAPGRYDADLMNAKLTLVDATKDTLGEFLNELGKISSLSLSKNETNLFDILKAEAILIDRTKEAYQMVYDHAGNALLDIQRSTALTDPLRKAIASRVLLYAANNLRSFAVLRMKIYGALAEVAGKKTTEESNGGLDTFQNDLKNELLSINWNDESTWEMDDEDDKDIPLTPGEEKTLRELLVAASKP